MGDKSEPALTEKIGVIGKYLDTRAGTMSNAVGALVSNPKVWQKPSCQWRGWWSRWGG